MALTTDLEELAKIVSTNSKIVKDFFAASNIPPLSFSKDALPDFPPAPQNVETARRELREASLQLYDLATGPAELLMSSGMHYHDPAVYQYICNNKIAEAVPLDGTIGFADLAAKTHTNQGQLRHLLRYATTLRVFSEPSPGQIEHTAASKLIAGPLSDLIGYSSNDVFLSAARLTEACAKYPNSQELNEAGFNLAYDTSLPILRYFANDPVKGPRFARTMKILTARDGYHIRHVVAGFDWASLHAGSKVVDVGGSYGHASIAIAEAAPQLNFVVQDLPEVVQQGELECPANMKDRIKFMAHDFFTPQPVAADLYFMRFILHDYPDKYAAKILQNMIPALKNGSRILVMDGMMSPPGMIPPSEEKSMRMMDLLMMELFNSNERELFEWEALLKVADSRFKIKNITKPPQSIMSVMEVVFEDA